MCNILIYEPEAIVSLDLISILKDYRIVKAKSVRTLINNIRLQKFDMIIINVSRLEGWTHLTSLLHKCNVPLIILTTFKKEHFTDVLRENDWVITFPYSPEEILKAVEFCCEYSRHTLDVE